MELRFFRGSPGFPRIWWWPALLLFRGRRPSPPSPHSRSRLSRLSIQSRSWVDSESIMSRFSEQGAQIGLGLWGQLHVVALLQRVHIRTCSWTGMSRTSERRSVCAPSQRQPVVAARRRSGSNSATRRSGSSGGRDSTKLRIRPAIILRLIWTGTRPASSIRDTTVRGGTRTASDHSCHRSHMSAQPLHVAGRGRREPCRRGILHRASHVAARDGHQLGFTETPASTGHGAELG